MAAFVSGLLIGVYTGAMIREEYYFPTSEKISKALEIYKKNKTIIEQAELESEKNKANEYQSEENPRS